jgi:hypothetical protein
MLPPFYGSGVVFANSWENMQYRPWNFHTDKSGFLRRYTPNGIGFPWFLAGKIRILNRKSLKIQKNHLWTLTIC